MVRWTRPCVFWRIVRLGVLLLALDANKGAADQTLLCFCTTLECQEAGVDTCTTTGMCYTEQPRRGEQARQPMMRGCVEGKTSLLCEEWLSTVGAVGQPSQRCCDSTFCNRLVPPSRRSAETGSSRNRPGQPPARDREQYDASTNRTLEALLSLSSRQPATWRPGPLVIAVLTIGLLLVVGISVLGVFVLRWQRHAMDVPFSACPSEHGTA